MEDSRLPWERSGEPEGIGVCLSGGGLRAASFSFGAVQALQQDRGLLYGERSADHLAVVSGGSYLGAANMLTSDRLADPGDAPPLAPGTPEAEHVVSHGDYLKSWGTVTKMALGGAMNLAAFVVLFLWAGVMVTSLIVTTGTLGIEPPSSLPLQLVLAVAFVFGGRIALRGLYMDEGPKRGGLWLLGLALLLVGAESTLALIDTVAPLSDTGWWTQKSHLLIAFVFCVAVAGLTAVTVRVAPYSRAARAGAWLAGRLPAAIGAVLFCLVATGVARPLDQGLAVDASTADALEALALLFGALLGAVVMGAIASTSLHRMYRDSLATCYSIVRGKPGVETVGPTDQKLSDLAPPEPGSPNSFPRLLVCATANVVWNPDDPSRSPLLRPPSPGWRKFASFVYSHDRCGLPGVDSASFATTDLEQLTTHARILPGREPLVSLMSAVASTGAAISPAMGRRTSDLFRPLIALANLRLGRWLPNPLSPRIREIVSGPDADRKMRHKIALGGSYDEFVPELFGYHHADAPRVYISDGGHYDNLGLLALLQARCREIWCIDAEADPEGKAGQLREVLGLARSELGIDVEIDLECLPGPEKGLLNQAHVSGEIVYPGGAKGRLVVVKLGLTPSSDDALRDYRQEDKGFPHHSTFWPPLRVMWYSRKRVDSYRALGYANALSASRSQPRAKPAVAI